MLKRTTVLLLVFVLVASFALTGCGGNAGTDDPVDVEETEEVEEAAEETEEAAEEAADDNWKIAIMTGTVVQNEEEYRAAQNVQEKYGEDHVKIMTYPAKFMDEQETTISNVVSMVSDPDVKALIFVQAIPGASAAIEKAREINPDLLVIAGTPGEDPKMISDKADLVFAMDEIGMGTAIPEQAKAQGAEVFVHYSFPRHMSYALLSARRDLMKETCEEIGLEFVDATAPDPTGDAGVSGAQQFILEDIPRKIDEYGKDTAFFATNCSLQVPIISAVLEEGAIYPQPCCPSPYHGFPSALGIEIPEDKRGDLDFVIEASREKIAEAGNEGRMSTWGVPVAMMFIEAGADYAKAYIDGETDGKVDEEVLREKFETFADTSVGMKLLDEGGTKYDNYYMILLDFLNY